MTSFLKKKNELWAIILAAGSGQRLQNASKGLAKQYLEYQHQPLYLHSAITFSKLARLDGLIFVFPEQDLASQKQYLLEQNVLKIPYKAVAGGELRQDSAYLGLQALPKNCGLVFIHDAARPFFTIQLIQKMLNELEEEDINAIIPAIQVTDSIKEVQNKLVSASLDRSTLVAVQTPQLFKTQAILKAHRLNQVIATDDAALLENIGLEVKICDGEISNIKITYPKDLKDLEMAQDHAYEYRTTYGEDIHKFCDSENIKARVMKLGGVEIAKAPYIEAHSDGDVLLHALADAILSAASSVDIGQIFSDQDPANTNLSSALIIDEALNRLQNKGGTITFVDLTIISEKPKIAPEHSRIINNIARLLGLTPNKVTLKAKTSETLGFIGQGLAIKAIALVNSKFTIK